MAQFAYHDDALHITVSGTEMRFGWLPSPCAEDKNARGEWKPCWLEYRLLRPPDIAPVSSEIDVVVPRPDDAVLQQKHTAYAAFRASIPPHIVALVEPFSSHQWTLLKLLHDAPAACDLARSNPVLCYCLANNAELKSTRPEIAATQACHVALRKQRAISHWLGFPNAESSVNLFRKIAPEAASPSLLRRLRNAIADSNPLLPVLSHCQRITASMLQLVLDPHLRGLATPKLLAEMALDDAAGDDTINMLYYAVSIVRQIAPERVLAPFDSIVGAREFSETINAEFQENQRRTEEARVAEAEAARCRALRREQARQADGDFQRRARRAKAAREAPLPPPPVPGTTEIIPLTTPQELKGEGILQHNCVAAYVSHVQQGSYYFYRVLYPERATLAIIQRADGSWKRDDVKKARNHQVRSVTKTAIDNWLAQHRTSV